MRNISFALTSEQILARTKTVTRRVGWANVLPGTLLQPVRKGMGLKRGEKVEKLGVPIRVVNVRREPPARMLRDHAYGLRECVLEGFGPDHPKGTPLEFVRFFCESHKCQPEDEVTRIEFEYTEANHG